ncbi:beta-eliminating lyase-related protein [Xanthobacter sp. KR7-225]|uniref:threonine aldolase family protein n=1 Tax=Xanthobacter sp. KR7-225 TaxID=3156613 RepID=UPI0032B3D823
MDFLSENTAPVHPAVVDAVVRANDGYATNFESEAWTTRALAALKEAFGCDLAAFTVSTGTAANAVALGAITPRWGGVLCHFDAHIETDECGAPEMFTAGARQIPIAGDHGKIDPAALATFLEQARFGVVHAIQPAVLSLTQLTEAGTAYRPDEIAALTAIARRHGLLVHMDGARFANAVVAHRSGFAEMSWQAGVDVLTLGTTKSGTFGAEVVITFRPELAEAISYMRKRGGHFAPKTRFLAAQVEAYLSGALWRANAETANAAAARLSAGLARLPGVEILHPTDGNEVFVAMPDALADHLWAGGVRFHRDWRPRPRHHRFVMSWAARSADIDAVLALAHAPVAAE